MTVRDRRVARPRRRDELAAPQPVEVARRRRVVRQVAGQHLVHRHAERVEVGREHRAPLELFGRHVRRAADDGRAVRGDLEEARRAEVADLQQAAVGHEDVRRPEVAMDDALLVRVLDGVGDLAGVVERRRELERARARR